MDFPANSEDFEFAKKFWELATGLLADKKLKVHPVKLGSGGLDGVLDGMQQLKDGKVVV
jgi:hypothetical protein